MIYNVTHTIVQTETHLWTVGYYLPDGKWHPITDHSRKHEAIDQVSLLNGERAYEGFKSYVLKLLKSESKYRMYKSVCSRLIALIEKYGTE